MTNKQIGKIFEEISKILEVKDPQKNRFRVLAYQKAAQAIENMPDEIVDIYKRNGTEAIEKIPGVGESISKKIEEIIKTGKLQYLEELKKKLPAGQIEFLEIPGIGPKMAEKLIRELKAKNIKDLTKKIDSGEADKIFKEKTRANILRGIKLKESLTGRMLINEALPIAEELVLKIKRIDGVKKVDYVGSLRRMKETIGDIDIVATADDSKKVIDEFTKFTSVSQVISKGNFKSTIIHQSGVQVDLEMVPEEEYGSLLQHFTGSKEHNVALRTYAQTQSKSVSEHGIKYQEKINKFNEEKDVYNFLGMAWIPPELREDRGEIRSALQNKLPELIELKDIRGDLHVHSKWSDGNMMIEEIAKLGEELGYEYIVVSDHTVGLGIAHGLNEKALEERQKEIDKVQKNHKIKILSSVEVNIKADATLDIESWMLEKMDIVTASVHSSFRQEKEVMTKRIIKAIENPHIDVIGHPSGRIIGVREPYEVDWPRIFKACATNNTALEISSFPNRLDLRDYLCKEAKSYGVKFAINTDSHLANHLELMRFGVAVARRGWLAKNDIINTKNLQELINWINEK